jgi:hypothetical protein
MSEVQCLAVRNDIVTQMFNEIRGMAYNFARRFNLEFDDCLQHAALTMLEVWPKIPADCTNVKAYLCGAIKWELYQFLSSRGQETLSLDASIAEGSAETFADMLQAFVRTQQDEEREDFVAQVTHAALKECKLEEQMYARERYGLNSFNPAPSNWSCKPNYNRRNDSMRASIQRNFRRNPQVLALVQK